MSSLTKRVKGFFIGTDDELRSENVIGFIAVATYLLTYLSTSCENSFTVVNLLIFVYKSMFVISMLTLIKKRALAIVELIVALVTIGAAQVLSKSLSLDKVVSSIGIEVAILLIGVIMAVVTINRNKKTNNKTSETITGVKKWVTVLKSELIIERPRKTTRFIWIGLVVIGVTGFYISELSMNNNIPFVTAVWTIIPMFSILLTTFGYIEAFVMRFIESLLAVYVLVLQILIGNVTVPSVFDTIMLVLVCIFCIAKSRIVIKGSN